MRRSNKELVIENMEIYLFYRNRLENLALSQFEWHGLPDTCDAWFFERQLLYRGAACMCKPEGSNDLWTLGFIQKGDFDGYGYPANIDAIDFLARKYPTNDWVIVYDNMKKESIIRFIDLYARKLYEVDQTIRTNLRQQNTPYIIPATKNTALSIKNIMMRIFGFDPVITVKGSESTIMQNIKPLDLKVDFKGNELNDLKESIWAEALHILGIAPSKTKKERMITGEVSMDRQEDIVSIQSRLLQRVRFCDKINKRWGLDVSVNLTMFEDDVKELTSTFGMERGQDIFGNATTPNYNYSFGNSGENPMSVGKEKE